MGAVPILCSRARRRLTCSVPNAKARQQEDVAERAAKSEPAADAGTLSLIHLTMQRRGFAAEIEGVMSFHAHERLRRLTQAARPKSRHAAATPSPRWSMRGTRTSSCEASSQQESRSESGWPEVWESCRWTQYWTKCSKDQSCPESCCRCPNTTEKKEKTARDTADDEIKAEIHSLRKDNEGEGR